MTNGRTAGGMTEHHDTIGVTIERADVVANPLQRGNGVQQPPVPSRISNILLDLFIDREKTQSTESIVDGHDDDVRAGGRFKRVACEPKSIEAPTTDESATMYEEQDWPDEIIIVRPNIQEEAIFVPNNRLSCKLGASWAQLGPNADAS